MRKNILNLFKAIVLASLCAFVTFFLINNITRAVFEKVKDLNFALYCVNAVTYAIFFYIVRINKRESRYFPGEKLKLVKEIKAYFFSEGKFLLCIYGVLAIVCEIEMLIPKETPGRLICTLCSMFFPFFSEIDIPILRSVASIIIISIILVILTAFHSYRVYKKEKKEI